MTKHQWRGEDGDEIRYWRANYHGGRFELYTKTGEDDRWQKLDPPSKKIGKPFAMFCGGSISESAVHGI